jgi:ferredoxin
MVKLVLVIVSFVPDVVSFVVDHVPQEKPPVVEDAAERCPR